MQKGYLLKISYNVYQVNVYQVSKTCWKNNSMETTTDDE